MKQYAFCLSIALSATALLAAPPARADVVPEPPMDCLDGTVGETCHGGPYCAPDTCTTDAECDAGKVCKDRDLCTATIDCGGMGGPAPTTEVTASCGEACPAGDTCSVLKVCVTASSGTGGAGGATTSGGAGGSTTTGGTGGASVGGAGGSGGGGGDDVVVSGCSCRVPGAGTAVGAAGALLFALGLAGLGGRRRRQR